MHENVEHGMGGDSQPPEPDALEGFLLCEQAPPGLECIIAVVKNPQYGRAVMSAFTELSTLKDPEEVGGQCQEAVKELWRKNGIDV